MNPALALPALTSLCHYPLPVIAEHAAAVNVRRQLLTSQPGLGLLIACPQFTRAKIMRLCEIMMAGLLHFGFLTHWELVGTGLRGEGGDLLGLIIIHTLKNKKNCCF